MFREIDDHCDIAALPRQAGSRPARDERQVVPLTTARATMRFAGTTLLRPTAANGLRQTSVALMFQLRTIDRRRMQERIGTVNAEVLNAMFEELGKLTGRRV